MSFYLLAVLSSIVDLFVQAILETMLSSQDTETGKKKKLNMYFKGDGNAMGKTPKDRKQSLRYVKCFCCVSVLYVGGCEIPTRGAAMLPATEPHRDVKTKKKRRFFFSSVSGKLRL